MKKSALITGIAGQDGSYLAEYLLEKQYTVYGTLKEKSDTSRISKILGKINIVGCDLTSEQSVSNAVKISDPKEIYNLAAPSFPAASWKNPVAVTEIISLGATRLLEAARNFNPDIRIFQASSSEIFGNPLTPIQNESSLFRPRNPYGVAKLYAHWMVINYRNNYGLHASNGIQFNHESPRRGMEFVTRKISYAAAKIYWKLSDELVLGDLEAKRDWGFAGDYVTAMWLMLRQKEPDDYIIATGETHSVREAVEIAFDAIGIKNWEKYVISDKSLVRPPEKYALCGDSSKARKVLGWKPETPFKDLIKLMVESDIKLVGEEMKNNGKISRLK